MTKEQILFDLRAAGTRLLRASGYSLKGLQAAFQHEQAFRQEVYILLLVVPLGLWLGDACAVAGIHPATFRRWMDDGELLAQEEEVDERGALLVSLWQRVSRAEADAMAERLRRIKELGETE